MKKALIIFYIFFINSHIMSQPGWNWPEDKATAEEKNVL